ncbi:DUF3040 domain-containing protein [Arenivirga flava]|uniref:DUF3040 domain-containing protein n=1 Tax=Arenivirga flava TaxID=1930060 RepID=A0AA37XAE0_9MICO|nr:DUF3040 domain-containing protein [Arenivirga flava]GMA27300.1 hypothetical protein GCM10025874_05530 [Arenivirga flava]
MPLSEQEQRLLDEMERNLYKHDADFVATVGARRVGAPNYRMIVIGVLVALLGVATIVTGVALRVPVVGILGFVLLLGGALLALSSPRGAKGRAASAPTGATPKARQQQSRAGFMDRMNDRWERRQDGDR